MKIDEHHLRFFAAHALTGLASNTYLMSPAGKMSMLQGKTSIEKMAIDSALHMIARLEGARQVLDQMEKDIEKKENPSGTYPSAVEESSER